MEIFIRNFKRVKIRENLFLHRMEIVMDNTIDTIILDFGKVLVDFIPIEYLNKIGIPKDKIDEVYNAVIENEIWNEYDRGIMNEEEVLKLFIQKNPKIEKEIRLAFENLNGIIRRFDYTDKWIDELHREGFKVLYLSNISEKLFNECYEELSYIEKMDGGVLSFRDKKKKPDSEIYEDIIKKFRLNPEKCIFIDDREENLKIASEFNINTILFKNYEEANNKIKQLVQN